MINVFHWLKDSFCFLIFKNVKFVWSQRNSSTGSKIDSWCQTFLVLGASVLVYLPKMSQIQLLALDRSSKALDLTVSINQKPLVKFNNDSIFTTECPLLLLFLLHSNTCSICSALGSMLLLATSASALLSGLLTVVVFGVIPNLRANFLFIYCIYI